MKNTFYIVVGTIILLSAAFFSLFLYKKDIAQRPWVRGFLRNLFYSYQKYDHKSWIRRLKLLYKYPETLPKYIKILSNNEQVVCAGKIRINPKILKPQHDIVEDDHFFQRVVDYMNEERVTSDFGDIVIVNNTIHDGHHRVAAAIDAGIKKIEVVRYFSMYKKA
jgi:hypothetical protein